MGSRAACGSTTPRCGRATPRTRRSSRPHSAGWACPRTCATSSTTCVSSAPRYVRRAIPTPCCWAWAVPAWPRRCCAPRSASRAATSTCTCSIPPTRRLCWGSAKRSTSRTACSSSPASPAAQQRRPALRPSSTSVCRSFVAKRLGATSSPSPTKARLYSVRPSSRTSARSSSTRPTSAVATRRCRSSVSCRLCSWVSSWTTCSIMPRTWWRAAGPTGRRPRTPASCWVRRSASWPCGAATS